MLKILALDDDVEILRLVRACLENDGHEVMLASSIDEAQRLVAQTYFHIYIIDLCLGDGSGLDFAQGLRRRKGIGIIILSGRTHVADRVLGLDTGADDYLGKPFHLRELQARVRAVARRLGLGETEDDAAIRRFGCFEADISRRSVRSTDGREFALTSREFDVLIALVNNANQVISRGKIAAAAFGLGHEMAGRPVDGLISRLRAKMFADPEGPVQVKTVHGRGYMLTH